MYEYSYCISRPSPLMSHVSCLMPSLYSYTSYNLIVHVVQYISYSRLALVQGNTYCASLSCKIRNKALDARQRRAVCVLTVLEPLRKKETCETRTTCGHHWQNQAETKVLAPPCVEI